MLTRETNDRLTQVGMGTPMGELLRRYWHPVATLPELLEEPVLAVTILGENLARLLGIDVEGKKKKLATDQFARAQKQLVGAPALSWTHGW